MTEKQNSSKEKLIIAMASLILQKGFANTSPRDILAQSNVGQGSFYHHFKGKEDLALHAIRHNCNKLVKANQDILEGEGTAFDKLSKILTRPRDINQGCLIGQMAKDKSIMERPLLAKEITKNFKLIKDMIYNLIQNGISEGSISTRLSTLEATALVISVLQGAYVTAQGLQDNDYFSLSTNAVLELFRPIK